MHWRTGAVSAICKITSEQPVAAVLEDEWIAICGLACSVKPQSAELWLNCHLRIGLKGKFTISGVVSELPSAEWLKECTQSAELRGVSHLRIGWHEDSPPTATFGRRSHQRIGLKTEKGKPQSAELWMNGHLRIGLNSITQSAELRVNSHLRIGSQADKPQSAELWGKAICGLTCKNCPTDKRTSP